MNETLDNMIEIAVEGCGQILPLDNMFEHEMQTALSDVFKALTQELGEPIIKDYYYCSWDSQSDDEVRVVAYHDDNEGWIRIQCRPNRPVL